MLLGLTLLFYVISLFLTTSREYLSDGALAPAPGAEAAILTPPPPASIQGTPAADAWTRGIAEFR